MYLPFPEDQRRLIYKESYLPKVTPAGIEVHRSSIYDDVMNIYEVNTDVIHQFPFQVEFLGERAIDNGGVGRDFFPAFWEEAYKRGFDGASLVTPAVHAHVNMASFTTLGKGTIPWLPCKWPSSGSNSFSFSCCCCAGSIL